MKAMWVGAAATLALGSAAAGQVWQHDWTPHYEADGLLDIDADDLLILGGDAGVPCATEWRATVCAPTQLQFTVDYASADCCEYDYFYIAVNGQRYPLVYNEDQGFNQQYAFLLNAGDQVALGVYTEDGQEGDGEALVHDLQAWSLQGFDAFTWSPFFYNGSGQVIVPPPALRVTGGNAGWEDLTDCWTPAQPAMWVAAGGIYASTDQADYDQGYYYTNAEGYVTFIENDTQGSFSPFLVYVPAGDLVAYGVYTVDGLDGPGKLKIDNFQAYMYAAVTADFTWQLDNKVDGTATFYPDGEFSILGGNAGKAGTTELSVDSAMFDYCVEADFEYTSTDTDQYDRAYYAVNGARKYFADNAHQGSGSLDITVKRGDSFGFGVETADGLEGPGSLIISRFRAWAGGAAAQPPCYPDITQDGTLDLFDFLAFVNLFNAHDPAADCDQDGAFSLFDFLCFNNAFNAGC